MVDGECDIGEDVRHLIAFLLLGVIFLIFHSRVGRKLFRPWKTENIKKVKMQYWQYCSVDRFVVTIISKVGFPASTYQTYATYTEKWISRKLYKMTDEFKVKPEGSIGDFWSGHSASDSRGWGVFIGREQHRLEAVYVLFDLNLDGQFTKDLGLWIFGLFAKATTESALYQYGQRDRRETDTP